MSRRAVDGVLLLDKPVGIGSTAALARARRALSAQKAGHTGTLDPLASGLLPLCFGEATKFASDPLDADKAYTATVRLGVVTDTGDAEGRVVETRAVAVDRAALDAAVATFVGPISQVPPMHSALKRDGRPLYDLARRGIVVERAPRPVTIHRFDVLSFDGVDTLTADVACSKGTYVRVLAEDLGRTLGCGAHLAALRRTAVGAAVVEDAVTLEAFEAMTEEARDARLLPVDALIAALPRVDLEAASAARFAEGQRLAMPAEVRRGRVRVYRLAGEATLLGTGSIGDDAVLAPQRLIARAVTTT